MTANAESSADAEGAYACEICHELLRLYTVCFRGHSACAKCIASHKARRFKCPICRDAILEMNPMNVFAVRNAWRFGLAACDNAGCQAMLPLADREPHRALCEFKPFVCPHCEKRYPSTGGPRHSHLVTCERRPLRCLHGGCPEVVPATAHIAHMASCPHRLVECSLGCGARVTALGIQEHALACDRRVVFCGNAGCGAAMQARAFGAHALACEHRLDACAKCGEMVPHSQRAHHDYACSRNGMACVCASCAESVPFGAYARHMREHGYVYRHGVGLAGLDVGADESSKFSIDLGEGAVLAVTVTAAAAAEGVGSVLGAEGERGPGAFDVVLRATSAFSAGHARVSVALPCGVTLGANVCVHRPGELVFDPLSLTSVRQPGVVSLLVVPAALTRDLPVDWRPSVSIAWG